MQMAAHMLFIRCEYAVCMLFICWFYAVSAHMLQVYLLASHYCVLDDVIKPPGHFLVHIFGHIQLLDLSSKLGAVAVRVPFVNISDATFPLHCKIVSLSI